MCTKGPKKEQPSVYEQKLVQLSKLDHEYWKREFKPVENDAIDDAHDSGSDEERSRVRGKAHLATVSGMRLPGGNPNSSQFVRGGSGMGVQLGKATSEAATNADLSATQIKHNKLANLAHFGRGQRAIADTNLRSVAGYKAGHEALEATSATRARGMNMDLAGEVVGMGAGYGSGQGWFSKSSNPGTNQVAMNTSGFNNGYNPNLVKPGQALA